MAINDKPNVVWPVLLVIGLVVAAGIWWLNQGYGEVSQQTYEYSKAIYGACLNKNEVHLSKVETMLAGEEASDLPAREKDWLDALVTQARAGNWQAAAKKARRMMEDQVKY